MPCFRPLKGYRSNTVNPESGKRNITFNPREGFYDLPIDLPCGQCIGCRLERSRQWAIRCVHEASLYEKNCFITLTYSDSHLPKNGSLNVKHYQDFMKRLRFKFGPKIRFFHCGEYGEKFGRPHYHACIFNFDFGDKKLWKNLRGNKLYTSENLEALWPFGFSTIGDVTFESAAYVARYITKKITGPMAQKHYGNKKPEYTTMSRRPGIAKGWYEKYKHEVYPRDELIIRGKKMKPPKFYDRQFELDEPEVFLKVKRIRKINGRILEAKETDYRRLATKEVCQEIKSKRLIRGLENNDD